MAEEKADFVASLGRAFLAHRFKRASDAMRDGYGEWLAEIGVRAPARGLSTMLLLEGGPRSVTEIAETVRFSHPFVVGLLKDLTATGLVSLHREAADGRRRVAELTAEGRADAERIRRAARVMETAFSDLSTTVGVDLADLAARLDTAEHDLPFAQRVRRAAKTHNGEGQ